MRQSEFSDLAIVSIEFVKYIEFDEVIHKFAAWKECLISRYFYQH